MIRHDCPGLLQPSKVDVVGRCSSSSSTPVVGVTAAAADAESVQIAKGDDEQQSMEQNNENNQLRSASEQLLDNLNPATTFHHENVLQLKVFPVFNRSKKIIHLIRHGHTTYKEGFFSTIVGNYPFDVMLSTLGIQQATVLAKDLFKLGAELVLTSPLTRSLQTLQHASKSSEVRQSMKIEVCDLHAEHVFNSGDVGRPPKMLAEEFPWLSFIGMKDVWWYSPEEAPNDPILGLFQSRESMDHLRKRVGFFRQFLLERPEQKIAIIGHSTFFREFSGRRQRMRNCEILTIRI